MKVIDSVAAVFCHENRVFAVRRQPHLEAFPGYDSFPGGKIDRSDSTASHSADLLCRFEGQQMHALVREVAEELGYDLVAGIASGQVASVNFLAKALAPTTVPIRFRLYFFRIDLKSAPEFIPDPAEIETAFWATPEELLASYHAGDSLMVPPLRWVLEELMRNPRGCDFGDLSPQFDEENFVPVVELFSGLRTLPVPSNTLPPATRTNAFLLGDESAPQILVDPSPRSADVLVKLLRSLRRDAIDALFITHHHPDHHEHAPTLARELNRPVWMSEETRTRILLKHGADYFSGVHVETRQEGDVLTTWKGEAVRVHAVPGHDAGQLALAPESMRWFLVGDLVQNIGTVVISAPEGDMGAYYQTLKKVIALAPAIIVPSHGIPMRSTYRLQAALQHRLERETSVLRLHKSGKTPDEMLVHLYQGLEPGLHALALENIKAHLAKLRNDGRI